MRSTVALLAVLIASGGFVACGGPRDGDESGRVRARLAGLFEAARAGDGERLADYVVYRGGDVARKWKDVARWSDAEERRGVEAVQKRVRSLLDRGSPRYLEFRTDLESEGRWLVWKVAFGEGEREKTAHFAFLDLDAGLLLGDVD